MSEELDLEVSSVEDRLVSQTEAAEILGVSRQVFTKYFERIGPYLNSLEQLGGNQKRFLLSEFCDLLKKPPDGAPANNPTQTITEQPASVEPFFVIMRGGDVIDEWEHEPDREDLKENFGAGRYRVLAKNPVTKKTIKSRVHQIDGEPLDAGNKNDASEAFEKGLAFAEKLLKNRGGDGNTSAILDLYKMQLEQAQRNNERLTEMIADVKRGSGEGGNFFEELPKFATGIETLKALGGLINGEGDGETLPLILDKLGQVAETIAPALIDKYGGGNGAAQVGGNGQARHIRPLNIENAQPAGKEESGNGRVPVATVREAGKTQE